MLLEPHGAVVELHHRQGDDEHEGQKGVEVVGDGPDKELDAADTGVQVRGHAGDGGGPGTHRGDHAYGGGGGVDEVAELGPGDPVAVGDGVWLKGIYARSLDKENPGKFTAFIDKLRK